MADEVNFVRLNKQNIDLKRRLCEAEETIDELRVKLSQQTQHIFEVREGPKSLSELLHGKVAGSSPPTGGSEPLKQGQRGPAASQSQGAVSSAITAEEYDAMESELEAARATELQLRAELQRALEASGVSSKYDGAELTAARKRIEELQSSERKLKEALNDLNSFVESGAGDAGTAVGASGDGLAASSVATDLLQVELEMVRERLGAEEAVNAEWETKLRATQLELDELRSTLEQHDRRLNEAISERNIAVRVKNEALKEAALARAEVERLKKDALRAPQRKHDDPAASVAAAAVERELRSQVASLETRVHQLDTELALVRAEAAKAQKAGKRAFVERQSALKDLETWKREAMAGGRKGLRGTATDQASTTDVVACAEGAAQKFDALISAAATTTGTDGGSLFGGGDDWAQYMYEAFFDYERQICNLKSEVLSLQAIAQMNEADASVAFRSQIAAHKEEIDVLRGALNEHRQKAASTLGNRGPVVTGVTVTAVPLGYPPA